MAGARRPGPVGIGDNAGLGERPTVSAYSGFGQASPIGVKGAPGTGTAQASHRRALRTSAFVTGAIHYRLVKQDAVSSKGREEEVVPPEPAAALVAGAPGLTFGGLAGAALVQQVRRGAVVLLRARPQSIEVKEAPLAPVAAPAMTPSKAPKPVKEGWVEIEVSDEEGNLRAGDRYQMKLPDGRVVEGTLGSNGLISLHGIDPGNVEFTFPDLDGKAWE